ncbi:MAG: hypothetical protein Fur0021_00600 [Candidatus Promineifilaceae bacterium]
MVNTFLGETWGAESAGTNPAGYVHPLAQQALDEIGVDVASLYSKSVEQFRNVPFDLVITVCDDASENCPLWLGPGRVVHISFPDPAAATGSIAEKMDVFRRVRDDIRAQVLDYLHSQT